MNHDLEQATIIAHCLTHDKCLARMRDGQSLLSRFLEVVNSVTKPEESKIVLAPEKMIKDAHTTPLERFKELKKPAQKMSVDFLAILVNGVVCDSARKSLFWKSPIEAKRILFVNVHKLPRHEAFHYVQHVQPTHMNYRAWVTDFCCTRMISTRNGGRFSIFSDKASRTAAYERLLRRLSAPEVKLVEIEWVEVNGTKWGEYDGKLISEGPKGRWIGHGNISVEHRGFLNCERINKAKTGTVKFEYLDNAC